MRSNVSNMKGRCIWSHLQTLRRKSKTWRSYIVEYILYFLYHVYDFSFNLYSVNCKFLCSIIRFVEYKPTSLEKNYKHEMLTEVDLGVNIDLIDPDTYALDPNGKYLINFIQKCVLRAVV